MNFIDTFIAKPFRLLANNQEYYPLKFRQFFLLEENRSKLSKSLKKRDKVEFTQAILDINRLYDLNFDNPIFLLVSALQIIENNTLKADVAFLRPSKSKKENHGHDEKFIEYDGRYVAQWVHLFADEYHWDIEKIYELEINQAAYLIQEILVQKQLDREWEYSLTPDIAYQYNEQTKKSIFKPMVRPEWMQEIKKVNIPKTKIRKDMLPFGVVNMSGMERLSADEIEFIPEETPTKE